MVLISRTSPFQYSATESLWGCMPDTYFTFVSPIYLHTFDIRYDVKSCLDQFTLLPLVVVVIYSFKSYYDTVVE